mgnify:CR=1 FL=1
MTQPPVPKDREEARRFVLQAARDYDVRFVRLWFTDILGFLKSFSMTVTELEKAMEEGMGFDGSSIEGFTRIDESDMIAMPDPTTFSLLPWRPRENAVARMFCDVLWPDGRPFEGDPRHVLKQNLAKCSAQGYTYYVGPELEYFYFKDAQGTEFVDRGGYFDLIPPDMASDLRRDTVLTLEAMGIPVEVSHHEVAPSQHEIDLRYTDALTMADNVMTYRIVVKQVAQKHGVYATFMPKPVFGVNGSGMHVHQSLFQGERNAFFDPHGKYHLSALCLNFMAGLLRHAPEITMVTSQWVNSYKRLVPGYEAPVYLSWAQRNRSDLIRQPVYKQGKEKETRFELRSPDPACNPYLCFSVMLAAGLAGVTKGIQPAEPVEENVFEMGPTERERRGIGTLPGSLWEAICLTEQSPLVRRALGEHVFTNLIANKKIEWDRYRTQVTEYEIKQYLAIL